MTKAKIKGTGLAGLLFILCYSGSEAQNFVRYRFQHIFPDSGRSSLYVRKVLQDPFGYIWIGTEDGLNRYDGKNFVSYNKGLSGNHAITGMDIRDLILDTANCLIWEINSYGGIDAINYCTGITVFSYFQRPGSLGADIRFTCLLLVGKELYIGSTNGLYWLDTKKRELLQLALPNPFRNGNAKLQVDNMLVDSPGRIWLFCTGGGLTLINKGRGSGLAERFCQVLDTLDQQILSHHHEPGIRFYECTQLRDGTVLSATNFGLIRFTTDSRGKIKADNDPYPGVSLSQGQDVYACRQDRKGNVWFCISRYLVRIGISGKTFDLVREHTSRDEFGWLDAVFSINFDKDDNLWLGCQQGLAFALNQSSGFFSINKSPQTTASIRHAYSLNPVSDSLLYCCAQDGLYAVNPVTGSIRQLAAKPFFDAFMDPFGRFLVASRDGPFILDKGQTLPLAKIYPEFRPLKKLVIITHCLVGDSLVLFGTENDRGMVEWNFRKRKAILIDQDTPGGLLNDNTVNAIYRDTKGLIWVLGEKSVTIMNITRQTSRSLNTYNFPDKLYSIFFDICQVKDRYYLASYGSGVLILDSTQHVIGELTMKDGLSSNSVYKILPYKDSLLFVTSNNGLSIINIGNHYQVKNYYESDGLHSNNFEESSGTIWKNIVYAGGTNGITAMDPLLFPSNSPRPRLLLRRIKIVEPQSIIIDSSDLFMRSMEIPSDAQQTTLYFSSINYPNTERSTFEYRIKDSTADWINNGTQDFVTLSSIVPGKYILQVRSANEDGVWTDPIELTLDFLPKWYQTVWFKFLVLAAISGLLYAFYRYRIGQLGKQQQIRKDIASDLHDDIGSTLNTVKIFTHLAKREQQKEEHLTHIEESLAEATMGLRDMIWVLDDSQDTIRELSERIKKFAIPVTTANNIHFECSIGEDLDDQAISKTAKRNLLLIAKETINNSIKYAACNCIRVSIQRENGRLHFSIRDDGKGFDTRDPAQGNGLKNIQQRALQIRYEARIVSSPGNGTLVEIIGS